MADRDELIDDVMVAQEKVAEADQEVRDAIAMRAHAVAQALKAGCGAQPIAEALGVGRHRVYQMRDQGQRMK